MPSAPTHLEIKNWSTYQHYKDRRPPWIKLYGALLDDPAFLALSEVAQAQLLKLWLLASRMCHPLPHDAKMLAGKIGSRRLLLDELTAAGFVIPCYQDASVVLAKIQPNVRPLSTEGREQRTETQVYTQGESANTNRVGVLEAGELIDGILALKFQPPQGHATIPLPSIEAQYGAQVVRAYKAVGGARRFLATTPDKRSFLLNEFRQALTEARTA